MPSAKIPFLFALFAGVAFAQLDTNSLTVTASRSTNSPADQAVFGIFVDSDLSKSLTDIVSAVSAVGITQANFSSLSQSTNQKLPLEWGFGLLVPLAKLKDTAAALTTLQANAAQNSPGLAVRFSVAGTQSSQSAPCSFADLLNDANIKAQSLAAGAVRPLGGILALSTSTSTSLPGTGFAYRIYPYSFFSLSSGSPCLVTVKYALGN